MLPGCNAERRPGFAMFTIIMSTLLSLCRADAHQSGYSESLDTSYTSPSADSNTIKTTEKCFFGSCTPGELAKIFFAVTLVTIISCSLLNMVGFYLLLQRQTNLILRGTTPKTPSGSPRRISSMKPGLSTTESTTSSVLVKMMKQLKSSVQPNQPNQTKDTYENQLKMGSKVKI